MAHRNNEQKINVAKAVPIKIAPLSDFFREDIYNLYKVYRPECEQNTYYIDN